ncbi:GDYXXLXY domain-containing protein [Cellulosilyticum sp. I15G10I2]|uniref:GDYXXLXY domain-containing protein n=1 Tax=Cellulosilyticum sp. I15G10I2 TaxID=1892843 RepID=UPI00085CD0EE|nr:GDYXXLXY domain-containing protein [Cellulosilyticum sp. I15G10I2]
MFKNNRRFQLLIITFFVQFLIILYISLSYEIVALIGNTYQFKIEGYDPIDPLRGRYLAYIIDTDTITNQLGDYTGRCYITIAKDNEGYAYLDRTYKEKPKEVDYIVAQKYGEEYYQTYFTKYFINEAVAQKAEELFRENNEQGLVVVKVKNGRSIVEGLYIGDKLIENYFE